MPTRNSTRRNRRNPIAQNPLMRKGGVHGKSNSAKRQKAKRDLLKQVRADFLWHFGQPCFH